MKFRRNKSINTSTYSFSANRASNSVKKRILPIVVLVIFGSGAIWVFLLRGQAGAPGSTANQETQSEETNSTKPVAGFDKTKYSIDQPGSPWWIVNKKRSLEPLEYVPPDLVVPNVRLRLAAASEQMKFSRQAIPSLEAMFEAAQNEGLNLVFGSGYRSYALQKSFYDGYVTSLGQAEADRTSARPGTSEHQTGLAFDATVTSGQCHLDKCFADLPEGQWVKAHAHEYGFIIRYQQGKEAITGYDYEPWHLRYVGKELAAELKKTGQTLEEFFGL